MAKDNGAKQRAAEKRRRREIEMRRKKSQARQPTAEAGETQKALAVKDLPIVECVISEGWEERGLAHILLVRRLPDGNVMVGGFYVDTLCLGIKDSALLEKVTEEDYRSGIKPAIFNDPVTLVDCDPVLARAVALGAENFASRFGFKPGKRWSAARTIFADIEQMDVPPVFGREGKPCYVKRDETNGAAIEAKLARMAGPGNYLVREGS